MTSNIGFASRSTKTILLGACIWATTSHLALAADAAPTAPAKSGEVVEVIVTAQRRSEAVSKVPASITAISSQTIEKYAIETFADYAKLAPNLAFGYSIGGPSGVTSSRTAVIRGITGSNTTSFYIDDTPLPQSIDPRMFNLDHIEVLRGPQGTLFGASSMGGTVRVITRPPAGSEVTGNIDAQGFKINKAPGGGMEFSTVVYAPVIKDAVNAEISAFYNYTPGYFQRTYNDPLAVNVTAGTKFVTPVPGPAGVVENQGASQTRGANASLRITPPGIEGLTLTPMAMYQHTVIKGFPLADYEQNNLVQRRILNVPELAKDQFFFYALTGSYRAPIGRLVSSTSYFRRATYDQEDGSDANVAAFKTAYLTYPQGPFGIFVKQSHAYGYTRIFTQEARYESEFDFPVQIIGGIFYQKTTQDNNGANLAPGLGVATGGFYTDNIFTSHSTAITRQFAGFAGLTYKPFERLELSAGIRKTSLKKHTESTATGIFGTPGVTVRDNSGAPVTPRLSAKYNFTPDTMVYATAAQGFRLGGVNGPITAGCAGKIPFPTSVPVPYDSDKVWSYEGGIKTKFMDNRISVSADVYKIDWTQIQQNIILVNGSCFASLIVNLGTAVSQGAELETNFQATKDLSLSVSVGYDDGHIIDPGSSGSKFFAGEPLSGVPKWTAAVSADYEKPMPFGSVFIRGNYTYAGQSISYTENVAGLIRKAYSLVDMRAGAKIKDYTIALFAKNLFDARANLSDEAPVTSIVAGRYRYFVGAPRTIGVDVKYNF